VAEEELDQALTGGFFPFSTTVRRILEEGALSAQAVKDGDLQLLSTLIHGPPGSGKTGIAAKLALDAGFPFVKFITPNNMVGMSEAQKVQYLDKIFRDADKSQSSLIVVDEIEAIIDYVGVGPRFSNSVLQTLRTFIRKVPPKNRFRLILCTTSQRQVLSELGLLNAFSTETAMPYVLNGEELSNVLAGTGDFDDRAVRQIPKWLMEATGKDRVGVGVKDILTAIGRSKKSDNMVEKFVDIMAEECAKRR
jgi:vesicle-fusing ATPase